MARPRKPNNMKLVEGTYREDRANLKEPQPKVETVKVPSWLSPKAKTIFMSLREKLMDSRVLTSLDANALELLADAYYEYREARRQVKKEGHIYKSTTKNGDQLIRTHPSVYIADAAWKRVQKMMSEFGLTPASRSKVSAEIDQEVDEYENRRIKNF